jgi:hypothetical protein
MLETTTNAMIASASTSASVEWPSGAQNTFRYCVAA